MQSIVLHKLELSAQKSSFPTALGLRVTGVDDSTYSLTGDAYSAIAMPNADTHMSRTLQEDDTSLGGIYFKPFLDLYSAALRSLFLKNCAK